MQLDDDLPFVNYEQLPVVPEKDRWLVEELWPQASVGILGGGAKLGKSVLTAELAVSVASGEPFLGIYDVSSPGPVLICSMEGAPWLAPDRLRKVARHRGVAEGTALQIDVLDRARLRLDDPSDIRCLVGAIRRRSPRLLILDPLVRLHSCDENAAVGGISSVLDELTAIQRTHRVSILLVHHVRKNVRRGDRPGLSLRGTSDLAAWGDVNWFLRESGKAGITLTVEHRTAAAPDPLRLQLIGDDQTLHFDVGGEGPIENGERLTLESIADRVIGVLDKEATGLGFGALRDAIGIRAPSVMAAIRALEASRSIHKVNRRWCLRSVPP